jgi:hypothetical protein
MAELIRPHAPGPIAAGAHQARPQPIKQHKVYGYQALNEAIRALFEAQDLRDCAKLAIVPPLFRPICISELFP